MEDHKREKNGIYRRRDIAHVVDAKHAASFSGDEADDDEKAVGRLSDSVRSSHIAEEKCSRRGSESGASSKAAAMAQIADEKERQREELREDEEANEEFERLKRQPTIVQPTVAQSQMAKNFVNGFKLWVISHI